MITEYPDYETYSALYRRYLVGPSVTELLHLLEPLRGARFLDLCSGEGELALNAIAAGAGATAVVDVQPLMIAPAVRRCAQIQVLTHDVHDALVHLRARHEFFDRVACRQAVNYWLTADSAKLVWLVLASGGVFAFNTFNVKPPKRPRVLEYPLDGHHFTEVSWLVGDRVHHVQIREGMAPHATSFRWISPEEFREMLEPHFRVAEVRRGKTSLYRCEKK